ncbi:MAG: hypothetical protein WCA89_08670 [Terracidiphilus sp.]|jgi:hypothetical protein
MAEDQQGKTHSQQNQPGQTPRPVPPTHVVIDPSSATVHIKTEADNTEKDPPEKPGKQFLRPEWIIVYITAIYAVISALMLVAIKRQANHMETSERAWLVAIPENAQIPPSVDNPSGVVWSQCSVRYVNKGKTPAFVIEAGHRAVVQDMKQPLPDIQPAYAECAPVGNPQKEVSKWDGDGFPVQPEGHIIKNWIGTWCVSAKRIRTGFDFFWVYGYVKYRDTFGHPHETWYCYRWNPGIGTDDVPTFTADGPKGYNRVT